MPAVYSRRFSLGFETGCAVMELVRRDIRPRDIVTKDAILNAFKVNCAIGGSTNVVMHLLAIAYAAHVKLDIDELGDSGKPIPHLVPMIPAGHATLLDFYEAGGVPVLMKELGEEAVLSGITCTGKTMAENIAPFENKDDTVILHMDKPQHRRGGIAILRGSLAPDGAVTKPSAIPDDALVFEGPAKIYESEQDALAGIRGGGVQAGDVVVIRGEGPKGSPGMPEMYKAMKILVGMGLGSKVCLVTDGRFSGSNNGCFVGHICPEAADDGPIAYLKEGDLIRVNVPAGTIDAPYVDFDARRKAGTDVSIRPAYGCLYQYRKNVLSASKGAIIPTRDEEE